VDFKTELHKIEGLVIKFQKSDFFFLSVHSEPKMMKEDLVLRRKIYNSNFKIKKCLRDNYRVFRYLCYQFFH